MNRLFESSRAWLTGIAALTAVIVPGSAFGAWWIVRSADEKCLVVDIEPTPDKEVTRIGKDKYDSAEEAEADVKRLCGADAGFGDND
jgi:hypothetical protein